MDREQYLQNLAANLRLDDLSALAHIARGAVTQPMAGIYGLVKGLRASTGGLDEGLRVGANSAREMGEKLAGKPLTKGGEQKLQALGEFIEPVTSRIEHGLEKVGEYSPALAAGLAGTMAVVDPTKVGGKLGRALRRVAKVDEAGNSLRAGQQALPGMTKTVAPEPPPIPSTEMGGQQMLPGLERGKADQLAQAEADRARLRGELEQKEARLREERNARTDYNRTLDRAALDRIDEEQIAPAVQAHGEAAQRTTQLRPLAEREQGDAALARLDELRGPARPDESLQGWLDRAREMEGLKEFGAPIETPLGRMTREPGGYYEIDGQGMYSSARTMPPEVQPAFRERMDQLHNTRDLVRQLRDAVEAEGAAPGAPPLPGDLADLTTIPTSRAPLQPYSADRPEHLAPPANREWWSEELGVTPDAATRAFMEAARHEPSILQYGLMPENAYDLEDFAREFGRRGKKHIEVERREGSAYDDYDEPYKIEREKEHGRGEVMRDRWGEYKQEPKLHEPGDYPMYDEHGDVKMKEAAGPVLEDEDPLMVKLRAIGGEEKRDSYGDPKYRYIKSEGGEPMRDERGNIKYEEVENPDYNPPGPDEDGKTILRTDDGEISIDYSTNPPTMYAMDAGQSGALLYQTALANASNEGMRIGVDGLTPANQFRMLSNTLANAVRTGTNPRNVSGTLSGNRPRATGYAKGEEIWRALAGEADARIAKMGGDPNAVQFTGEGFTINGQPATTMDIFEGIDELSPGFRGPNATRVGPKSVMQNAVYKWLEKTDPEEARKAARNWGRIGAPLFGGIGATSLLVDQLRGEQPQE